MQLSNLCSVLPADDEKESVVSHSQALIKSTKKNSCGPQLHYLFRKASKHFFGRTKRTRENRYSGLFHDTDGVQLSKKIGGDENPRTFSYSELYIGTKGFSKDEILGSGGFGRVFRAVLPSDGTVVAVKCLIDRGAQFEKSFMAELVAVAQLRHRNLVRLRGWCNHDDQLLLVYDYMPNLSLDRLLFRRPDDKGTITLDWIRRRNIVNGLAAALFYLHEQLEAQIIHRDVKTSNVMLDSHYNARLGDFGLARWLEHELGYQTETPSTKYRQFHLTETTKIGGTIGYLPPESFQKRGVATAKSDVFSFGIVVLEIVSGRRAVDLSFPDDQIILLDWVRRLSDEGMLLQVGDTRLKDGSYKLADMEDLIHLGLLCTLHDPNSRPSMKWVVEALSGNIYGKFPELPSFKSHPLYISISSPSNTTTTRSTAASTSITTTTSATITFNSSSFVTANAETIYVTAENEHTNMVSSSPKSLHRPIPFSAIETPREITYKEIISATDNFSDSNRLAEVDFGTAYHGFLDNQNHVLVKRLGMKTCPALRTRFTDELLNLGRLRHRSLIQLRGWCTEHGEILVVYDYSPKRLLSHLLFHEKRESRILRWNQRYDIIKSLAYAIRYLHEEWNEQVIHRNITSSSICVDQDMNPRLGSFALAEFLSRNEHGHDHADNEKNKSVRGIFGYISPEYMESGEATTKADVYSFGVVILEVVSGEMAVDFRRPEALLVERVHEFEVRKRNYEELADRRLGGEYDHKQLVRLVKLAMACTRSNPESRPSIRKVVSILDGHDQCFMKEGQRKERTEEWKQRNASSLSLVKRIQSLGIQ